MSEGEVLQWIKDLPIGAAVRQSRWLFGLGETLHFIGLCLMGLWIYSRPFSVDRLKGWWNGDPEPRRNPPPPPQLSNTPAE